MESIWGSNHDARIESFEKRVSEIEEKYSYFLNKYVDRITGEAPDKLNNHYILRWDQNSTAIAFNNNSYLPASIQQEVIRI
jgi:hypothetical protein